MGRWFRHDAFPQSGGDSSSPIFPEERQAQYDTDTLTQAYSSLTQSTEDTAPGVAPSQEHVIRHLIIGLNAAPERTGIAPYTSGLAERLAASGDDVRLLTAFPHYPEWRFVEGAPPRTHRSIVDGVAVTRVRHRLPKHGSSSSRVLSELTFGLRALVARWDSPDAVLLVSPAMFASAMLVPRLWLQRIPFAIWVQDLYGLGVQETAGGIRPGLLGGLVGRLEGWLLRRADSVVVIHEQMSAAVLRLGVQPERVHVVRNWTHIAPTPQTDRERVRSALGWNSDETVALHTGNMGTKQDLRNVVQAARIADDREAPVRFVLVGDGVERPLVESAAEGVSRLEVIPPQPDHVYEQMLQAADVLLVNEHPGVRGMAFPSKLTSYFTSGRPVLAASNEDSTTASELRSSSAGVRVAPGRPAELLEGVLALAADPERMRLLADAGSRYRTTSLSVESATSSFFRVLHELPSRHRGVPPEPAGSGGEHGLDGSDASDSMRIPMMAGAMGVESHEQSVIHPVTAELRIVSMHGQEVRNGRRSPMTVQPEPEQKDERVPAQRRAWRAVSGTRVPKAAGVAALPLTSAGGEPHGPLSPGVID